MCISANGSHTEPAVSVELSSSPDLEGVPGPSNRKRRAGPASPGRDAIRVKTEMLFENSPQNDVVDTNDTTDDEDFIQEPSPPGT